METLDLAHNIQSAPELITWMRAKEMFYKEYEGNEAHLLEEKPPTGTEH